MDIYVPSLQTCGHFQVNETTGVKIELERFLQIYIYTIYMYI